MIMEHRTEARFPGGYRTDISVFSPGSGSYVEFHTDYSKAYGGEGSAPTPWDTFLAAMTACQGIHVRNFCAEHNIPTEKIRVQMDLVMAEDNREVNMHILLMQHRSPAIRRIRKHIIWRQLIQTAQEKMLI